MERRGFRGGGLGGPACLRQCSVVSARALSDVHRPDLGPADNLASGSAGLGCVAFRRKAGAAPLCEMVLGLQRRAGGGSAFDGPAGFDFELVLGDRRALLAPDAAESASGLRLAAV